VAARRPAWGDPPPSAWRRLLTRLTGAGALPPRAAGHVPGDLPPALHRSEHAPAYRAAAERRDHPAAAATAAAAAERAITASAWWEADRWAHLALWHFEQAEMTLEAIRAARRIGELRTAAGDPAGARRYYAEAIDEARDVGAEREQGLAAMGLGRAHLDMGDVTAARRLASASIDLLQRADGSPAELASARALLGTEVAVGEDRKEDG